LIIKEVYGVMPFGYMDYPVKDVTASSTLFNGLQNPRVVDKSDTYGSRGEDLGDEGFTAVE
jgi:hypothetical protein